MDSVRLSDVLIPIYLQPDGVNIRGVRGGAHGGGLFILNLLAFPFLRQSTFYIALHSPKLKDYEKK